MDSPPQNHSAIMPPTILVVDDATSIVKLCKIWLKEGGFRVLEADGSAEALKIFTQHDGKIDLLLTDLVLSPPSFQLASQANPFPQVNGRELAMRAANLRDGLRVVLMSGNPHQVSENHKSVGEALPFLKKPFTKDNLITVVHNVLAQPAPVFHDSGDTSTTSNVDWFG